MGKSKERTNTFQEQNERRHILYYRRKYGELGMAPQIVTQLGVRAASKKRQSCPASLDDSQTRLDSQYWQFRRQYHSQVTIMKGKVFWVSRAIHNDQEVAIKHLSCSWDDLIKPRNHLTTRLRHEYLILRRLDHANIIKALDFITTKQESFLILPLMKGQDLFERLNAYKPRFMPENDGKIVMWQILQATQYLHQCNIIHRDIKLENIFLRQPDSLSLVLGDFEAATYVHHDIKISQFNVGTRVIRPPEMEYQIPYSFSVDYWCIGIVMYQILLGRSPFYFDDNMNRQIKLENSFWDVILANQCKEIIQKLIVLDPDGRMNPSQALHHPWFAEIAKGNSSIKQGNLLL